MKKVLSLVIALCLCLGCLSFAASEEKTYTIGVLQLIQHVALDAATQGFQDALVEKLGDRVTFDVQNASGEAVNCATIANDFVSANVDLIMANATPALQAVAAATADIPILGTSVTDYATALDIDNWEGTTGLNISGTCDLAPMQGQADLLHELFPDAKKVALLYCSAEPNSLYQINVIGELLAAYDYECTPYAFADSNDLASVVQLACDNADVLYVPTDNTAASYTETIANVTVPAGKPVVAGEEGICKGCGVATLSISYYDLGYATGLMAYEVLENGADVSTMPVQTAPQAVKEYNAEMVEILGITVPEDYVAIQ
ncbi:MAG: ABC transporter substrate-binding protein [Clostridia bacterium]|nr:ABC transporter substrate-binding protein [Clostridia bacterium]MBR2287117.1 ABC transporter substrate-binding protein [Clostridia bacterium]